MGPIRTTSKKGGVSRSVRSVSIAPLGHASTSRSASSGIGESVKRTLSLVKMQKEKKTAEERLKQILAGCSDATVAIIHENRVIDCGVDEGFVLVKEQEDEENGGGWEDVPEFPQENDALVTALREMQHSRWTGRYSKMSKTWKQRRTLEEQRWEALLPALVDAYLKFKYPPEAAQPSTSTAPPSAMSGSLSPPSIPDPLPPADTPMQYEYTLNVYDLWTLKSELTIFRDPASTSPVLDLMSHGYIAKSPNVPQVAVSVRTMELLYRLRQRKPSFSIEAFAKVVCDFYSIPYRIHLRQVFADTFEIYLRIRRVVDKQVRAALKWDTEDWRVKNACVACCYKIEDEPPLLFSRLYAFDGNNSLKRMLLLGNREAGDTRVLDDSDYFLPREFVDRFKNEVRGRKKGPTLKTSRADDSDDEDIQTMDNDDSIEGDPTDHAAATLEPNALPHIQSVVTDGTATPSPANAPLQKKALDECVKNWKSASDEDSKRMWAIFDEAGVFVSACRHGFILWVIDMIRSGELAKYPLATVAKVLEVFEPGTLGGYDIGCSFETTIKNSSLGAVYAEKRAKLCVNAFHGYSHCYLCQLRYHPNAIDGIGLEDLETLERVFSSSNQLASVTRYASPYRRRLLIEAYYQQWDEDKYLNLGTFLLNNYVQALKAIKDDTAALADARASLNISDADMEAWEQEEVMYFSQLGDEDPQHAHWVAYVDLLQQLSQIADKRAQANSNFLGFVAVNPASTGYAKEAAATRQAESTRRHAREQHERVALEVCDMEVMLGIEPGERWTPATPQYQETVKYMREHKYRRALDKLQKLVVLRLFELHKLNLSQTGYRLRTHLSKSIQTRCKTIKTAVAAYNAAAATLDPPRPPLDWSRVTHYSFLEEFNLLQDTRNDVRDRPWTKPAVRETMKLRRRILRAKEELVRCNVEVRRLHTSIRDECSLFRNVLSTLTGTSIHGALADFATRRMRVHERLLSRIYEIYDLAGFTGTKGPGTRLGGTPTRADHNNDEAQVAEPAHSNGDGDEDGDGEIGDDVEADIGGLIQYFTQL